MSSKTWGPERLDAANYPDPGHDLPVFYGDLDTNGHLNNVAFGRFFEQARFCAHRRIGLGAVLSGSGRRLLVARVTIDYLAEAHFGDLHVRTRIASFGRSSMVEEQAAFQNGTCVALAEVVVVFTGDRSTPGVTDAVREAFAPMMVRVDAG